MEHLKDHLQNPLLSIKRDTFVQKILRQKERQEPTGRFHRTLTRFHLTMYGVGSIIGAGIFALTGLAVQFAGPSLFLSFILAGFTSCCSAYMYAEFSSRFPSNGSAFIYVYSTFGELPAWIIGWYILISYGVAGSGLARALTYYCVGMLEKLNLYLP
jgi:APA family basic amino acid/polyamine antiporter